MTKVLLDVGKRCNVYPSWHERHEGHQFSGTFTYVSWRCHICGKTSAEYLEGSPELAAAIEAWNNETRMVEYTIAFLFTTPTHDELILQQKHPMTPFDFINGVYLIRKNRPQWQQGKLNGIGGHKEIGETFDQCCAREVKEEAGIDLQSKFKHFPTMRFNDALVQAYYAVLSDEERQQVRTCTDEEIQWIPIDAIYMLRKQMIDNIPWMVLAAMNHAQSTYRPFLDVTYSH